MNLKRRIRKEIDNLPMKSFEEWLTEHPDIAAHFENPPIAKKKRNIPKWIYAPASFFLIVAIVLPVVLSNVLGGADTPAGELPPITNEIAKYGVEDIDFVEIYESYFSDKTELVTINFNNILGEYKIDREFPLDETDKDVAYVLRECMIPFVVNGQTQAFSIVYRIRVYEHYTFIDEKKYETLSKKITIGEYEMEYDINNLTTGTESNVHFTHNKNDYYIYVREAQSVWPLTDTALQALLLHLFAN